MLRDRGPKAEVRVDCGVSGCLRVQGVGVALRALMVMLVLAVVVLMTAFTP